MRRILYLWVQHLHTQVEQEWDAALQGQPVVVAAGRFQRGTVIDASPEAEVMGVGAGMTWRHAHRRCPTARFIRYERPRYAPVIEQIGAVITRFTPWAELLPGTEDEFFIDLGAGDPADGARLVQRIQTDLTAELQLATRAALAGGKFPARTLCRGMATNDERPPTTDHRPPADAAAGFGSPLIGLSQCSASASGRWSVVGGRSSFVVGQWTPDIRLLLRPLSIDYLWELRPETRQRLLLLGIRTLGQLAAVPQRLLVEQFGPAGRWYRLLARGIDPRRVAAWQPAPSMEETRPVYDDEPTLPLLEEIVDDLAGCLSERLVRAGLYARSVTLIAHMAGGDRRFATHHLKAPAHLRRHLAEAAAALLQRTLDFGFWILDFGLGTGDGDSINEDATVEIQNPKSKIQNPKSPSALELRVGGLGARGVLQLSIFGEIDRGPALRAAIARIQDRFGERAVRNAIQVMAEIPFR